jgi:hypothetical protein
MNSEIKRINNDIGKLFSSSYKYSDDIRTFNMQLKDIRNVLLDAKIIEVREAGMYPIVKLSEEMKAKLNKGK